jgi:hypothetical protein
MSQNGQEDILDGELGEGALGEDVIIAGALGAYVDVVGKGWRELKW